MTPAAIVYALIVLHRVDGGEVHVNPQQVTSLRATAGAFSAGLPGAVCVVGLTDRKFVSVLETCAEVKRLLEQAQR